MVPSSGLIRRNFLLLFLLSFHFDHSSSFIHLEKILVTRIPITVTTLPSLLSLSRLLPPSIYLHNLITSTLTHPLIQNGRTHVRPKGCLDDGFCLSQGCSSCCPQRLQANWFLPASFLRYVISIGSLSNPSEKTPIHQLGRG